MKCTKLYVIGGKRITVSWCAIIAMIVIVGGTIWFAEARADHSHAWLKSSESTGTDGYGNPVKICNWRCASDRSHTTTTSGSVCSYPL